MTSYSAYWIGQLAKRYNERGPAGMHNRQHTTSRRAARVRSERDGYTTDRPLRDALPSDLMTDVNSDSFTKKLSWAFRHHNGTRFGNESGVSSAPVMIRTRRPRGGASWWESSKWAQCRRRKAGLAGLGGLFLPFAREIFSRRKKSLRLPIKNNPRIPANPVPTDR
ncbi:MAG TPA: hypothetical protein VK672_05470 [Solirubrobacteraceae bacterium]|nr:hypothetical protein [Solirubrobacteraceae bacterium]